MMAVTMPSPKLAMSPPTESLRQVKEGVVGIAELLQEEGTSGEAAHEAEIVIEEEKAD